MLTSCPCQPWGGVMPLGATVATEGLGEGLGALKAVLHLRPSAVVPGLVRGLVTISKLVEETCRARDLGSTS